jgi:uncharacterized hydrophobic protein (TIGR00341 family)
MPLRKIEVCIPEGHGDTIQALAEEYGAVDYWASPVGEDGRKVHSLLIGAVNRQTLLDRLQTLCDASESGRITVHAVDYTLPTPEEPEEAEEAEKKRAVIATREELLNAVASGGTLTWNFILLTVLSAVVAAIGLLEDNVAVVIGAMVIAPLLGPNLAFSLGAALGETKVMLRSLGTNLAGICIAFLLGALIGLVWPGGLDSEELMSRTGVDLSGVALALISGAAGVLSLTTGLSTALVGVMVAVALLPPVLTMGVMAGYGQWGLAAGAGLLLMVNVVCVNLSAQLVFLLKGIKPRSWLEKRAARESAAVTITVWVLWLAVLVAVIVVQHPL